MRRSKCSLSVLKVVFSFSVCRFQQDNLVLNRKGKCLRIFFNFLVRFDFEILCEVLSAPSLLTQASLVSFLNIALWNSQVF